MVDIVRVANEKRTRCEGYTASLAIWHAYLCLHARWVLGVMHDKVRGVNKRKRCRNNGKRCSQEECGNLVVQSGVCVKHGAMLVETQTLLLILVYAQFHL
jgi:hypothetical protein